MSQPQPETPHPETPHPDTPREETPGPSLSSPASQAGLWCPVCGRPVDDPLTCGDCSSVICRVCGTPLDPRSDRRDGPGIAGCHLLRHRVALLAGPMAAHLPPLTCRGYHSCAR